MSFSGMIFSNFKEFRLSFFLLVPVSFKINYFKNLIKGLPSILLFSSLVVFSLTDFFDESFFKTTGSSIGSENLCKLNQNELKLNKNRNQGDQGVGVKYKN